jgi:LPXTG-motif cell wall-anchored protein
MSLAFIFGGIVAGLFCVGAFLWSVVEEQTKKSWLVAAGILLIVGIAGFFITR